MKAESLVFAKASIRVIPGRDSDDIFVATNIKVNGDLVKLLDLSSAELNTLMTPLKNAMKKINTDISNRITRKCGGDADIKTVSLDGVTLQDIIKILKMMEEEK